MHRKRIRPSVKALVLNAMSHWPTQLEALGLFLGAVRQPGLGAGCLRRPQAAPGGTRPSSVKHQAPHLCEKEGESPGVHSCNNGTSRFQNKSLAVGNDLDKGNVS